MQLSILRRSLAIFIAPIIPLDSAGAMCAEASARCERAKRGQPGRELYMGVGDRERD